MTGLLLFFALVLAVNLLPAFGPPTWTIITFYALNSALPLPSLIVSGAIAAALGRLLLAHGFRLFRARLSPSRRRSLAAAKAALAKRTGTTVIGLALFALSPLPSAQLFEAAGLMNVRLLGFTAAFFGGRLVSYSIYAGSARSIRASSLGGAFSDAITSAPGIAIQLATIAVLIALVRIDWVAKLSGKDATRQRTDHE